MRKNFGAKAWTYPQPVFIIASYDDNGVADAMNAAWGGISEEAQLSMCLSAGHKTVKNILARGAFTVSMADAAHVAECDYVGIVSANDVPNKLEKAGLHTTKSQLVDAPLIDELPMIAVMAAFAEGTTVIRDAQELRVKESDRIQVMTENLRKMGAEIQETEDGMIIHGGKALHGAEIDSHLDHRVAMSFAVAGLLCERTLSIKNGECVNISYPEFYSDLYSLAE